MFNINHWEFEAWVDIKTLNTEFCSYIDDLKCVYMCVFAQVCTGVVMCKQPIQMTFWEEINSVLLRRKTNNEGANNIWTTKLTIISLMLRLNVQCGLFKSLIQSMRNYDHQLTSTLNCQIQMTELLSPQNHFNNCLSWTF